MANTSTDNKTNIISNMNVTNNNANLSNIANTVIDNINLINNTLSNKTSAN